MIELMFILYLIELLSTIEKVAHGFIALIIAGGVVGIVVCGMLWDIEGIKMQETFNKFIKPDIKRYILVLSISFSVATLIPSERTMYIMAGLYAGDKVLDTVSQSETLQKAEQLLNQKLDEMLEDTKNETQTNLLEQDRP